MVRMVFQASQVLLNFRNLTFRATFTVTDRRLSLTLTRTRDGGGPASCTVITHLKAGKHKTQSFRFTLANLGWR